MTDRGATKSQLAAANRAAVGVKLRVSGGLFQLGWALFFFELFTSIIFSNIDAQGSMTQLGMRAVQGGGGVHFHNTLMVMALPIMLLAARPPQRAVVDARLVCVLQRRLPPSRSHAHAHSHNTHTVRQWSVRPTHHLSSTR